MKSVLKMVATISLITVGCMESRLMAGEGEPQAWRQQIADRAAIMSTLKWGPVTTGMPIRRTGEFQPSRKYTGVPYSNGGYDGRAIGFDINLRTYLAALENPESVLYKRDLRGQRVNSAAYYGMVCSIYVSYTLGLGANVSSSFFGPDYREGVRELAEVESVAIGDVLWSRGHVEVVTGVTHNEDGTLKQVVVEDSWPPTTRTKRYSPAGLEEYKTKRKAVLYRIDDYEAFCAANRADKFSFPNYELDRQKPVINRTLLLDHGDWVAYYRGDCVLFNVMDRDEHGVKELVIREGERVVATIPLAGRGVVERKFDEVGNFTAHCTMADGAESQACEFAVADLSLAMVGDVAQVGQPLTVEFKADNLEPILFEIRIPGDPDYSKPVAPIRIWLSEAERKAGRVVVPAEQIRRSGSYNLVLTAEGRYGRLKRSLGVEVTGE